MIRQSSRLRRGARYLRNRLVSRALLLLYHRVAEVTTDPHSLCVAPEHFAAHLEVLKERYRCLPLPDLPRKLGLAGRRPAVVVTFDDGYVNNLYNAKPILERHGIPATVFVATGYLGRDREFWWDELDRLLLQPGNLPPRLDLKIDGLTFEWDLDGTARYTQETYARQRGWRVPQEAPSPRQRAFQALHQLLRPLRASQQHEALDQLRALACADRTARPTHRPLSELEVCELAQGGLVEIGAHTVTHPVLARLPLPEQEAEIRQSKACLEKILGRPVTSFAYPYGWRSDYTPATVAAR